MLQLFRPKLKESRSLELLRQGLQLCYNYKDVIKVKEVLQLHHSELLVQEVVNFNIEIRYRQKLIKIAEKKFSEKRYAVHQIASFFKTASYVECDAVLLHIDKNKDQYRERNEFGYDIFKAMWGKRKHEIQMILVQECTQQKTTIFEKIKVVLFEIFKKRAINSKFQKYGYE